MRLSGYPSSARQSSPTSRVRLSRSQPMMKAVERALSNASRTAPKYWPASISTAARPARSRRQALWPGLIGTRVLGLTMPGRRHLSHYVSWLGHGQ